MIPTLTEIHSRLDFNTVYKIITSEKDYFVKAEKYLDLYKKFNPDTYYEKALLIVDMILTPLIGIANLVFKHEPPSMFSLLSIQKVITVWYEYYEYKSLQTKIREWKSIVQSIGGPFISANDSLYAPYVYADGMMRILLSLTVPKESTKRA